ncbi:MAG: DUF4438 domain-containing protein [Actinomycetota bacterium]
MTTSVPAASADGHPVPAAAPAAHLPTGLRPVAVNLLGLVEHPVLDGGPYRIDVDGHPYVPVGDGGIVLGLHLGDPVFGLAGDHAAPGACLVHPDPAARYALATYACIGNQVTVRTGHAVGARGAVAGKRGEEGRVITVFRSGDLAVMRPGDQVSVRACGQGHRPARLPGEVTLLNADPGLLGLLGSVSLDGATMSVGVRCSVPSKLVGNGLGRPAASWDIDLQLAPAGSSGPDVLLGDLLAVTDLDSRFNIGYRRGWVTVGVVVHGSSPLPGHGPGITPILTGPASALAVRPESAGHSGLTAAALKLQ